MGFGNKMGYAVCEACCCQRAKFDSLFKKCGLEKDELRDLEVRIIAHRVLDACCTNE